MDITERLLILEKRQIASWYDNVLIGSAIIMMVMELILANIFHFSTSAMMLILAAWVFLFVLIQKYEKKEIQKVEKEYKEDGIANYTG